jgi:DNA-binding NarL/FixJ family response regulator
VASSIRVLIADDHPVVLRGLSDLLSDSHDIVVVGQACDGGQLVEQCVTLLPDVVIVDIKMPGMNGIEAVQMIRVRCPKTYAIVLSLYHSEHQMRSAFAAGASAYLTKESNLDNLQEIVRDVSEGKVRLPPTWRIADLSKGPLLTPAELQTLLLWVDGLTTKEIGERMGTARGTVDTHKAHIMKKIDVHKETQVVVWAVKNGFA